MEEIIKGNFYNPTRGNLSFDAMVKEIFDFMLQKPEFHYEIVVGCDSPSDKNPFFPVAIVILRQGQGGRFFLKKIVYKNKNFYNLHQRILEEVTLSCQIALNLRERIKQELKDIKTDLDYQFLYIHADIGENGATKDMIKEVVGLIKGNGFEAKIKPESYAASIVADRYT